MLVWSAHRPHIGNSLSILKLQTGDQAHCRRYFMNSSLSSFCFRIFFNSQLFSNISRHSSCSHSHEANQKLTSQSITGNSLLSFSSYGSGLDWSCSHALTMAVHSATRSSPKESQNAAKCCACSLCSGIARLNLRVRPSPKHGRYVSVFAFNDLHNAYEAPASHANSCHPSGRPECHDARPAPSAL